MIKIDDSHAKIHIDYSSYEEKIIAINKGMEDGTAEGSDFLGWRDYPETYDKEEFARIKEDAKEIRDHFDALIVCGIGGSYLGARAGIEAINGLYPQKKVEIIYMGQTVSPRYVRQVIDHLEGKRFAINVISKSGTTTETAVAFRLLWNVLLKRYGEIEAAKCVYATTDKEKGALLGLCKKYGFKRYVLPSDIGGRYSVFTAVGLLPMAVAGIDIDEFLLGAAKAREDYQKTTLNEAVKYAILRQELSKAGRCVENFVTYEPQLVQLGEWWKQLFGESEGKDGKGILPDSMTFTTDLHSLGQFVQEGSPILFETVLSIDKIEEDVFVPHDEDNLDGLNYLEGKGLDFVSKKAQEGTILAHAETGNTPNIIIHLQELSPRSLGYLMHFFMRACSVSAYLSGVNPFNQPGVEVYKKNMFHLLGKPGY